MGRATTKDANQTRGGQAWLYAAGLVLITAVAYSRVGSFEFLHYDDTLYVTKNHHVLSGLNFANLHWAFTTFEVANWQPLTWVSHMADSSMFGQSPRGPHVVNVLIHIANTLLLFWVLRRMTKMGGRSAFVAALFAVHPLHVESVAWIAERKDVLSTFFGLLALCAYALYSEKRNAIRYGAVAAFFAMSLMAKAMWVTLPFVLLLIDYWPLNRFTRETVQVGDVRSRVRTAVLEKVPLLGLTIASAVVTVMAQSQSGAVATVEQSSLVFRVANAVDAYAQYLGMFAVPHGMAAFYPHPGASISLLKVAIEGLVLVAISMALVFVWKRRPSAIVGWCWYLGTLVPVIGIVQVGSQAYADRYTYLPTIGLSFALVWLISDGARRLKLAPSVLPVIAVLIAMACTALTWVQTGYWRDDEVLWRRALAVTENNYRAHANLAHALNRTKDAEDAREAVPHFVAAAELYPDNPRTFVGLGNALESLGRLEEAVEAHRKAIAIDENHANAYINLGALIARMGQYEEGVRHLERALELDPVNPEGHNNLGVVYAVGGDFIRAIRHFEEALRLRPGYSSAEGNLARAIQTQRAQSGR